jgi:predicted PurR-regulated permease PerM
MTADRPGTGTDQSDQRIPRALIVLLAGASIVVVATGIRSAAGILGPIMLALVLTIAVAPVSRAARRRGWPKWVGLVLGLVSVYGIVLVLAGSLAIGLVQLANLLPEYAGRADELVASARDWLESTGLASQPVGTALAEIDLGKVSQLVGDLLGSLLSVLSSLFFLVTLLFFMTGDAANMHLREGALRTSKPKFAEAFSSFVIATQHYLVVSTIFGAIVAVLDSVALWWLGVPLPLLWGLVSFVTNFVPNIGFVIGVIPPALLALLDGGWQAMLAVIIVYSALNIVIQTFIQPLFVGDAVGLSTLVTFLSLGVWAFLLGPLGALLAIPATLLVRSLLIDIDPSATWVGVLIGPTPKPEPDPDIVQEDTSAEAAPGSDPPSGPPAVSSA